jgi:hypothetical protein
MSCCGLVITGIPLLETRPSGPCSRGNGLMTPQDKNFITRIQLQQLVAAAGNVADSDPEAKPDVALP